MSKYLQLKKQVLIFCYQNINEMSNFSKAIFEGKKPKNLISVSKTCHTAKQIWVHKGVDVNSLSSLTVPPFHRVFWIG